MTYFDIYYAYLEGCAEFNQQQCIEKGWEWHHTLPQCLYGDQPIGLWLTREQHAIASAYQTLAFNTCCICGWHLKQCPSNLRSLVNPFWLRAQGERGRKAAGKGAQTCKERRIGAQFLPTELRRVYGRKGAQNQSREDKSKAGKKGSSNTNSQLWEDPDHPELGLKNAGALVRLQRSRGYPSAPLNRRRVQ